MTKVYIQKSFPPEQVFYITDSSGNYLGSFDIDEDPIEAINEAMKKSTMVEDNVEKEEKDAEMSNNNTKMSPFEYALRQSLSGKTSCGKSENECCRSTQKEESNSPSNGALSGLLDFLDLLDEIISEEEQESQKASSKFNQDKPQSGSPSSEKDRNNSMTLDELANIVFTALTGQQGKSVDTELQNTIQKRNKLAQSLNTQIDDSINSMAKTLSMIKELSSLEEHINHSSEYERSKELDNIVGSMYKMSNAFHSLKSLKKTL